MHTIGSGHRFQKDVKIIVTITLIFILSIGNKRALSTLNNLSQLITRIHYSILFMLYTVKKTFLFDTRYNKNLISLNTHKYIIYFVVMEPTAIYSIRAAKIKKQLNKPNCQEPTNTLSSDPRKRVDTIICLLQGCNHALGKFRISRLPNAHEAEKSKAVERGKKCYDTRNRSIPLVCPILLILRLFTNRKLTACRNSMSPSLPAYIPARGRPSGPFTLATASDTARRCVCVCVCVTQCGPFFSIARECRKTRFSVINSSVSLSFSVGTTPVGFVARARDAFYLSRPSRSLSVYIYVRVWGGKFRVSFVTRSIVMESNAVYRRHF